MSFGYIYEITNLVTNKSYVGQTIQRPGRYIRDHFTRALRGDCPTRALYISIRRHGRDNFTWSVLVEASSQQELDDLEIKYVKKLNTYNDGYNMQKGGTNRYVGPRHTPQMKAAMSKRMRSLWADSAYRQMRKQKPIARRSDFPPLQSVSPTGKQEVLMCGLRNYCQQHDLHYEVVKSWIDRGKIEFRRHRPKLRNSRNAEGWEFKRLL